MKKYILIIALVGIFVLTAAAQAQNQNGLVTELSGQLNSEADVLAAKLVRQVKIVNAIKISGDIFLTPAFRSLDDRTRIIPDEPSGRPNPFAPF